MLVQTPLTISEKANICLESLSILLAAESGTQEQEYVEMQYARFNIWTANHDVFEKGDVNLDTRLKGRPSISNSILKILDDLAMEVEDYMSSKGHKLEQGSIPETAKSQTAKSHIKTITLLISDLDTCIPPNPVNPFTTDPLLDTATQFQTNLNTSLNTREGRSILHTKLAQHQQFSNSTSAYAPRIKCICSYTHDDGSLVECGNYRCGTWQHISCYYFCIKVPEIHRCLDCDPQQSVLLPRQLDASAARSRQTKFQTTFNGEDEDGDERSSSSSMLQNFSVIQCICGSNVDDGRIVFCSGCARWQHQRCYPKTENVANGKGKGKGKGIGGDDGHQCQECVSKAT